MNELACERKKLKSRSVFAKSIERLKGNFSINGTIILFVEW